MILPAYPKTRSYYSQLSATLLTVIFLTVTNADHKGVINIAHFQSDTFFILEGGALWVSGANNYSKHGDGTLGGKQLAKEVLSSGVAKAAVGDDHSLLLMGDGSLWGAGSNNRGQLGLGETREEQSFVEIVSSGVIAIEASWERSFFVKQDGSLWGMGDSSGGALGTGNWENETEPVQIFASGVADVSSGHRHTLILMEDGSLWSTGDSVNSALGIEINQPVLSPIKIIESGVIAIAAGKDHSVILKNDGSVWTAGIGTEGELGDVNVAIHRTFTQVATDAVSIHAGPAITFYIKNDGSVWDTAGPESFNLVLPTGGMDVVSNHSSTIILTTDGSLLGYGDNSPYVFGGYYDDLYFESPIELSVPPLPVSRAGANVVIRDRDDSGAERTFLDGSESFGIEDSDLTWLWEWQGGSASSSIVSQNFPVGTRNVTLTVTDDLGHSKSDSLTVTVVEAHEEPDVPLKITKAVAGYGNAMVILNDGSLWGRGLNRDGALANGTFDQTQHWQQLIPSNVEEVSLNSHSLVLLKDGSLYSSGANRDGQLGTDTVLRSSSRIQMLSEGVSKISATTDTSIVLKLNGSVLVFGENPGVGVVETPPLELYPFDVIDIVTGASNHFAIKSDASAWGGGSSSHGSLGEVANDYDKSPFRIFDSNIRSVRSGTTHSLFLTNDGVLYGLGTSRYGQLGLDDRFTRYTDPLELFSEGVASIEAWGLASFVVKEDGSLWAAGKSTSGGLGTGTSTTVFEFTEIMDSGVVSVSASSPTLVLKEDGSLWGMGSNSGGALGLKAEIGTSVFDPILLAGPAGQIEADAGFDIVVFDTNNDGIEPIILNGTQSKAPWNIESWQWSWNDGEGNGSKTLGIFKVGTTSVLLKTASVDDSESFDSVNITVLPSSSEFDQWLLSHFSQETIDSWGNTTALVDPDEDGLSNLDEWILQLDPANGDSNFRVGSSILQGRMTLSIYPAASDFDYTLWSSTDAQTWSPSTPLSSEQTEQALHLSVDSADGPFFKVAATPKEPL